MARVKRSVLALLVLVLASVSGVSCSGRSRLPRIEVVFAAPTGAASKPFSVEVVSTHVERSRGLMFRKSLGADEGMLFVFDRPAVHTFWMKDTFIALDMVFVSEDMKVVGILEDVPPLTQNGRSVGAESLYVLEFTSGAMRERGVKPGYSVRFVGQVPVGEPSI